MDMNAAKIFEVARFADIEVPQEVTDAEALLEAAEKFRDDVANEPAPDYTTATVKGLAKLHAAGVDHARRTERLQVADDIVKAAQDKLGSAMFTTAGQLTEPLAERFTLEADKFTQALADLGGNPDPAAASVDPVRAEALARLREAGMNLDYLKQARDAIAFQTGAAASHGLFSREFEELSRVLYVPDVRAWNLHRRHTSWLRAVEVGCEIRWQSPAEQAANADEILNQSRVNR